MLDSQHYIALYCDLYPVISVYPHSQLIILVIHYFGFISQVMNYTYSTRITAVTTLLHKISLCLNRKLIVLSKVFHCFFIKINVY